MRGGVGHAIQSLADFLVDESCHACRRPIAAVERLAPASASAAAALAQPLRVGRGPFAVATHPLCRACCHQLATARAPIVVGTLRPDGSLALLSAGRLPAVAAASRPASRPLVVWPAFETDDRLLSVIHALKFSRRERLAAWLARALAAGLPARALDDGEATVLLPVPMDRASLRRRGFNQAERLASAWAVIMGVRVERDAIVKVRATAPQSSLGGAERVRNVVGAMRVRRPARVAGRRVVLVDDLVTTGATAAACAVSLWDAGAEDVRVACVGYRP